MMENWLLIVVGVILLVSVVIGAIRGFFKVGLSLLSTVLTVVLVSFLSPFVGDALIKYTPADELIQEKCMETFLPEMSAKTLAGRDLSGTPLEYIDEEDLDRMTDLEWDRLGITTEDIQKIFGEVPKDQQIKEIEESTLPGFLKDLLLENNNTTIYEELKVNTFIDYIAAYMSRMLINVVSFLVTFILAIIIVKALMAAVDILGELPGIGALNHIGGALIGIFSGVLIVWVLFLLIAAGYSTAWGKLCFEMVEQSGFLTFLYDINPLLARLVAF